MNSTTRQGILDSGYSLIARKGFSAVGLAQILQSAGVPKGSFYHYFKSKEQFGEALLNSYFDEYLLGLEQLFHASNGSGYQCLMSYWQRWFDTQTDSQFEQQCLVVKLSAEVADLSEPMRHALQRGSKRVIERIAGCVQMGIDDGSIAPQQAQQTSETLYTMWLGASLLAKLGRNAEPFSHALSTTRSILAG